MYVCIYISIYLPVYSSRAILCRHLLFSEYVYISLYIRLARNAPSYDWHHFGMTSSNYYYERQELAMKLIVMRGGLRNPTGFIPASEQMFDYSIHMFNVLRWNWESWNPHWNHKTTHWTLETTVKRRDRKMVARIASEPPSFIYIIHNTHIMYTCISLSLYISIYLSIYLSLSIYIYTHYHPCTYIYIYTHTM